MELILIRDALLALHLIGAVAWVGGMLFAITVLRPALSVLEPPQRLAVHQVVFRKFFRTVWHVMPIVLLTGYGMIFGLYGGFGGVNGAVHAMHGIGLIMTVVFVAIYFGPWRRMQAAMTAGDMPAAATATQTIRKLVGLNLVLGLVTVAVAAFS